ncbi:MAG: hypothetical protein D8M59_07860 [Planctomycetes bacterium]|nr:hypothetical protein [Planctomycetota bacterium]NOG53239.1 hypothetical protein [Planctomycetota bacterium]
MTTSGEPQPETPADQADPVLIAFLAERDEPCPKCGYNLRGCTSTKCPECGTTVKLVIKQAYWSPAAWVVTIMGICIPLGACIATSVMTAIITIISGFEPESLGFVFWNLCLCVVPAAILTSVASKQERFIDKSRATQRVYASMAVFCGIAYICLGWGCLVAMMI